jgi:UDP-N-acetylmuramoyl-tripeptide--D-alanyl-D-alanine ligase
VLTKGFNAYATASNHNNMLGTLLTACGIPDSAQVVVFEMGSNGVGEIAALAKLIRPNIGVITGLGHAHIGKFGGLARIAYEKLSIADHLAPDGVMVCHESLSEGLKIKNSALFARSLIFGKGGHADVRLVECTMHGFKTGFTIATKDGEYEGRVNYPYPHLAENFLAAVAVGRLLNVPYDEIMTAANKIALPAGRGDIVKVGELNIINDCYNASLEAIIQAVTALDMISTTPKYALIGEIGEIDGYETIVYEKLVNKVKEYKNINFILSGISYTQCAAGNSNITVTKDEEETIAELKKIDSGVILVKASRKYGFERYINFLKATLEA